MLLSAFAAYGVANAVTPNENHGTIQSNGSSFRTVNLSETDYPDFTFAAESSVDAVVYVEVTAKIAQQYQSIDPFFQFFFGDGGVPQTREREQKGSGSGVIIRQDGYIATNNHVVQNATEVKVTLTNNKSYEAKIIGTDPATDVALLKIESEGLPVIEFEDSDKLRLGEWVLAIGSPLGEQLRSTVTAGIVSAKGRSMPNYDGQFKIESFIQTDAAVNPGNSGGALVNKEGKLVGINTAIVSTTGAYAGYSFAVPSNIVKKIVDDLIDFGSVKRAKLGISMSPINEKIANEMKLSSLDGVYINEVEKASAADKAGIKKGDVLVAIDSFRVRSTADVQAKVNSYHPDDRAVITVIRDGKEHRLDVTFQGTTLSNGTLQEDGTVAFYGATLKKAENGVEIVSVGSGKMAQAGAEDGYIIQYVCDQKVRTPQEVVEIAKKSRRSIFVEGVTPAGRAFYFGFGKDE